MKYSAYKPDGSIVFEDDEWDIIISVGRAYAKVSGEQVTITDHDTLMHTIEPPRHTRVSSRNSAYSFERKQTVVRVHEDDQHIIYEKAARLNAARESIS